jgi:hypothetical protein
MLKGHYPTFGELLFSARGAAQRRANRASAGALTPLEDHRNFSFEREAELCC